uniref:ATP synthase subunit a n=1 Tax=Dendrochiton gothicus TaxID=1503214 RepID=A0A6H1PGX1_9MOLL|nr:ATP synthase F0 subunit 6 [Dendrochiton gothicus]QIZ12622.1 ATP synthase F0 subunit 6 [Dendrochiton gothicus]
MMMDIFSSFDDNNFTLFSFSYLIWIFGVLPVVMLQNVFWCSNSRLSGLMLSPKNFMASQVMRTFGKNISGFMNMVISIFLLLIMVNLLGLSPYVFSLSSHLSFAFCFGFPFWLSLIFSGSFYNVSEVISHLLPSGAPSVLNPFLVLVETVSIGVRPITLSVRLAANMSAGHIILGLIGSYLSVGFFTYSTIILVLLLCVQVFYFLFEIGVGLIQAYIFSLLVSLYSDDHPS